MNYKPFSTDIWKEIETTLQNLSSDKKQPLIAAFDADGTLWDTDLGENFFQYQIDQKIIELPKDPFNHYLEMKKMNNDPRQAYMWLAQINKNQNIEAVRKWSQLAFETIQPNPIFSDQKKLISLLKSYDFDIYIVTASITWAVEPGAIALGLSPSQVIGVETLVQNSIVTDQPQYPITYRQGKVEALLAKTQQQYPILSSGNTMGDFELLQCSSHLKLAVSAASRDDKLFKTEFELQEQAKKNNWLHHRFI